MAIKILRPSPRYVIRLYALLTMGGIALLAIGTILAWLVAIRWDGVIKMTHALQVYSIFTFVFYLLSLWVAKRYSRGVYYELKADRITIHQGLWGTSEKDVYFKTVSGFIFKRDFLDRWLEISTMEFIMDDVGATPAIVKLGGIADVHEGYRMISSLLVRFWGEELLRTNRIEGEVRPIPENSLTAARNQQALKELRQ